MKNRALTSPTHSAPEPADGIRDKKYYISFDNLHSSPGGHFEHAKIVDGYIMWLNLVVGNEDTDWEWNRGDLLARGVYIRDKKCATLFKLKFGQ